jgi:hypothetical protein
MSAVQSLYTEQQLKQGKGGSGVSSVSLPRPSCTCLASAATATALPVWHVDTVVPAAAPAHVGGAQDPPDSPGEGCGG